jgi:hypothetical protein
VKSERYGVAQTICYRWKDEAERGVKAALGGMSAAAAETEKDRRFRQLERTPGRKLRDRDPKKRRWEVSWGEVHQQARVLVADDAWVAEAGSEGALQLLLYVRVR